MKITTEEFNKQPINKWLVTDSDGTVAPFVKLEQMELAQPPKEFLAGIRQLSFDNPDTGIMILSGRKNGELNNFYKEAMAPDVDGKTPKFVLASENGAFMQFRPINDTHEKIIPETHEHMHQMAEPPSQILKDKIEAIMQTAAGRHYTNDANDISDEKWIKAEVKKYGFTVHYKEPKNEQEKADFKQITAEIKAAFVQLGQEEGLYVHLGAASCFTIEKVSKGATIEQIADNGARFQEVCESHGMVTVKPAVMSYSGDDAGDRPALQVLNEKFAEGTLKGYTSRPNNYTPFDPEERTPNGPKELYVGDSLYILGSQQKLPQEMHRENFVNMAALKQLNGLRESLSDAQLLPSQNDSQKVPPIVLLSSGAILLQQPELYPHEKLENLAAWSNGKVVLMANASGEAKALLEKLSKRNDKLTIVDAEGQFFKQGTYASVDKGLAAEMEQNQIISKDPTRSEEIQFLRAIQELVVKNELNQAHELRVAQPTGMAALGAAASNARRGGKNYEKPTKSSLAKTREKAGKQRKVS